MTELAGILDVAHGEATRDASPRAGTPGRSTLTGRMAPSARAIARAVVDQMATPAEPAAHFDAATQGAGAPVPFCDEMEQIFGHDFGDVRAFVGVAAPLAALGAEAATDGNAIAFATSAPSRALVAHELTHVVQARESGAAALAYRGELSDPASGAEREAEQVAAQVAAGARSVTVSARSGPGLSLSRETDSNRDFVRARIQLAQTNGNARELSALVAELQRAVATLPGRGGQVTVRIVLGRVEQAQAPVQQITRDFALTRADALALHGEANQALTAVGASSANVERDRLRARIEALQANRDDQSLRTIMTALQTALATPAARGPGADLVAVHVPATARATSSEYSVQRADAATLHSTAAQAVASTSTASPAEHSVATTDQRTTSIAVRDSNWVDEHLANVHMTMRVGATPSGQVYAIDVRWRDEAGAGGAQLGFACDASSVSVNNDGAHTVDIRYQFRMTGSQATTTHGVGLGASVELGRGPQEASTTVGFNGTYQWSRADSATAGVTFGRAYRVQLDGRGFTWSRTSADNANEAPLTRRGATDVSVSTSDRTDL
ncbi:MAG: DUF4157 domain-containing protein [Myxococcales bacterium]|nr:DUF4157 domain-containing protein [Myxococcales bacterium]